MTAQHIGKGITMETSADGKTLTIKVDLTGDYGPSSSGKTIIVATTGGNVKVPNKDEINIGVNVYKKR